MKDITQLPQSIVTALNALRRVERYSRPVGLQRPLRDPGTGLFDPEAFSELASDRIERSTRSGGRAAVAVFELDLTEERERSLDIVGRAIRESIRPSDLATRTGPTTFVALLDRCDREEAKHVCSRIMRSVMQMDTLGRLCCGIAVAPSDGSSLDQLIATAMRRPTPVRSVERIAAAS